MPVFALGYAGRKGLRIADDHGSNHKIPSIKIGNMYWPDPQVMGQFIDCLGAKDILVSPSGPNKDYLAGAFRQGTAVFWLNPARLADFLNGQRYEPEFLLSLWKKFGGKPPFYTYIESDYQVAELAVAYTNWLATEREIIALSNSLDQAIRKELEWFKYLKPPKDEWVSRRVENAVSCFRSGARRGDVTLPAKTVEDFRKNMTDEFGKIYDLCLQGDTKSVEKAEQLLKESEMMALNGLYAEKEKGVKNLLKNLPHNSFFEGLSGVGTRSRSGVLVHIGNPLQFATFNHLNAYNGMRVVEGQAIRRHDPSQPEDLRYNHKAHQVLCFDFGDKAHYHPGLFQDLYYAYKCHQWLVYYPLVELTGEIFRFWNGVEDKEEADDEEAKDGGTPNTTQVRTWGKRLEEMTDLPMLRDKNTQGKIANLVSKPSWEDLKLLFSRKKGGGNLQMTSARIDLQAKRHNGITLTRIAYYRWLKSLQAPSPLGEDFIYLSQCRYLGRGGEPDLYDPEVTLEYYRHRVRELQEKGHTLPEDVWMMKDPKKGEKERFPGLRKVGTE